ncbi:MAG: gluconeogenesis factor YvcK family protein [Patescibacteria group bacterium]
MKKVVTIGGGTGSFMLLSGLRKYPIELSAIVSMADDGGSTGVLRDELGVLPPGDVRQCLVALSESSDILRDLMNYRFANGGLSGHSFGNLFLSALEKITGSFSEGVLEASKILNVKGEVIPVTATDTSLKVKLADGTVLSGEHEINTSKLIGKIGIKRAFLAPQAKANKKAIEKILSADLIVIGPGNHYCSILPNLLVEGIPEAILKSKAKVVYNCNLSNKRGHTDGFSLDDYVDEINGFLGGDRIDFVTFNTKKASEALVKRYKQKDGGLVTFEEEDRARRGYRVIRADLLSRIKTKHDPSDKISAERSFIRHDGERLAKVLIMLLELGEYESILRDIV